MKRKINTCYKKFASHKKVLCFAASFKKFKKALKFLLFYLFRVQPENLKKAAECEKKNKYLL